MLALHTLHFVTDRFHILLEGLVHPEVRNERGGGGRGTTYSDSLTTSSHLPGGSAQYTLPHALMLAFCGRRWFGLEQLLNAYTQGTPGKRIFMRAQRVRALRTAANLTDVAATIFHYWYVAICSVSFYRGDKRQEGKGLGM